MTRTITIPQEVFESMEMLIDEFTPCGGFEDRLAAIRAMGLADRADELAEAYSTYEGFSL